METVHVFELTHSDVDALLAHVTLSESTDPTSTTVTEWLKDISAEVCAALLFLQIDPEDLISSATDANLVLYQQCRSHIKRAVAGMWHVTNQNGNTTLGELWLTKFERWLDRLTSQPRETTGDDRGIEFRHPYSSSSERASTWSRRRSYR